MADNVELVGAAGNFFGASVEAPFSGDTVKLLLLARADYSGSEGSRTLIELHEKYSRADTYTGAGNGTTVDVSGHAVHAFGVQVKGTGAAPTAWLVVAEGSLDGTNFFHIGSHYSTGGDLDGQVKWFRSMQPCLYFRTRCVSVTLGSATNIVVTVLGVPAGGGGENGVMTHHLIAAGSTNAAVIKAAPSVLRFITGFVYASYPVKICFHNSTSSPTAGSGVVFSKVIPPGVDFQFSLPGGRTFPTGLAVTLVKVAAASDLADAGNTVTVANDALIEVGYE